MDQWMTTSCLGEKRDNGGVVYYKQYFNCVEINDDNDRIECLWVRIMRQQTGQMFWKDSVIDQPTRMKKQKKYSVHSWEKSHCH